MHFGREHPRAPSLIGAFTAVAGVILLLSQRQGP
jgi:drug/metabolite transporter (DMT)-like permease